MNDITAVLKAFPVGAIRCNGFDAGAVIRELVSAPTPPQPIYDEAKERELFAEWWRNTPILRVNKLQLAEAAWLACAQSRAKAVEVDHE